MKDSIEIFICWVAVAVYIAVFWYVIWRWAESSLRAALALAGAGQ